MDGRIDKREGLIGWKEGRMRCDRDTVRDWG
jgi:hypothetical protein